MDFEGLYSWELESNIGLYGFRGVFMGIMVGFLAGVYKFVMCAPLTPQIGAPLSKKRKLVDNKKEILHRINMGKSWAG